MSNSEFKSQHEYSGGAPTNRQVTPGGHSIDTSQPAFPVYHRKFANPAPLGLLGFASTTYLLSLINVSARGVTEDAPIIGMALAFGGTAQFLAGMWEFASGNTFGATAFSGYGAFWWSFAITVGFPLAFPAAKVEEAMTDNYLGLYLSAWFIFTFIMLMGSLRSSVALVSLFFFLDITFLLLFVAFFTGIAAVKTAGGAFGILTAAIAFYTGAAGLMTPDAAPFSLPVVSLAKSD